MRRILIVGATSSIAESCAQLWAEQGDRLFLAARNSNKLKAIVDDLAVRFGARAGRCEFQAMEHGQYADLLLAARSFLGGIDLVLISHGDLPDQPRAERDVAYALDEIDINGLSVVALLTAVANLFERQRCGTIVVISSVAGDRGRRSNYVYGSAKALVSTFMSGLRQRLEPKGVRVITVKPGPVVSPMTAHLSPGRMWGKPEQVARDISRAIESRHRTVYTPAVWRAVMTVIQLIPEFAFSRLKL
jgi:decaprenylphospho-beta-D-erythro-pentofuranosid-2-ulose 2-reductase